MVVADYCREWPYIKNIEDEGDGNIFCVIHCLAQLQYSNTIFQEFDGDDDDYVNLSGDASIVWHNWLYQGHLLKDDEQETLQEERH